MSRAKQRKSSTSEWDVDSTVAPSAGAGGGSTVADSAVGLHRFGEATQRWFTSAFKEATAAQVQAWESIQSGANTLVIAPTGSGKTLAAFLWALDRLAQTADTSAHTEEERDDGGGGVKVLYISPLKALGVDVERNLRAPLAGLKEASLALGLCQPKITVGVRSGDTTAAQRRQITAHPPDILITTPESLYLLLTSKAAEILRNVDTVIIDEVHALAGNKRGAHLALSVERLDALVGSPVQRIGLSATVEPASEVARYLGGASPVQIVRPESTKTFDITVEVPVEDMTDPPQPERDMVNANSAGEHRLGSMWPSIEASLYQRIVEARSTIVFTNSRRMSERLTARLNELHAEALQEQADPEATGGPADQVPTELARAHHGSMSKEHRKQVEEALKGGQLRCVVATASLELGIDMGEVDLVVQIDPPPSVSSGLQRMGRSGHQVGGKSRAVFYPTHRSKLIETAVIAQRMRGGQIEDLAVLSNPLDVLAQQTIAAAVAGPLHVETWYQTVCKAAPFQQLPRSAFLSVLDLVSGKFPSTEFSSLRARVDWDRQADLLTARPGAQRLAVTNGGTIPDRGLYRVVAGDGEDGGSVRVGELDEEMVYETRVGEVFNLGTTPWRVRRITRDTVEVEPAFGVVAKTPFWRGDSPSRPAQLGVAIGDLTEALSSASQEEAAGLLRQAGFDENAVNNALAHVREQVEQAGYVPTARRLVVEKTKDDVGDWQFILESPYGLAVHAPWALAINARLQESWGTDARATASNDGIIVRVADADAAGPWTDGEVATTLTAPNAADIFLFDPGEIAQIVREQVESSAVFAARFREAAARALILGSSKPGQRSPLWQQRLRSTALLEVASRYPDFPVVLEALREVLQDVYDVAALTDLMGGLSQRRVGLVEVETASPSPYARSLLFGYVGEFIYAGDTPAGERRIAALSVDPEVLRELLGEVPLKDLLEAEAITDVVSELQRTKPGWKARDSDSLVDLLRSLGPLTWEELHCRFAGEVGDADRAAEEGVAAHLLIEVRIGGRQYLAAVEDAGLLVALGVAVPAGVPEAFLAPVDDAAEQLLSRHLAVNGPLSTGQVADRFGLSTASVGATLNGLRVQGRVLEGSFLPDELAEDTGVHGQKQWVAKAVLDRLRSRSLALLRHAVEPASPEAFAQFLQVWQSCGGHRTGEDGTADTVTQLAGLPLPASVWETLVLPQRVRGYEPTYLDHLVSTGEVRWVGHGAIGSRDGWVYLVPAGEAGLPPLGLDRERTDLEEAILAVLAARGALFAPDLSEALAASGHHPAGGELRQAMWALVWDGLITSDSVDALRARISGRRSAQKTAPRRPRGRSLTRSRLSLGAVAPPAFGPELSGRWSLLTGVENAGGPDQEQAAATLRAVQVLERYGVVTRGVVAGEDLSGGFAQAYRLYGDFETAGVCRRGYFISGLGGAQFAVPGAVDELRRIEERMGQGEAPRSVTLASTDPANPYGTALPWPEGNSSGQPKRSAGSLVCILGGELVFYLERGGRTALSFGSSTVQAREQVAADLTQTVRRGALATFTLEKVDGQPVASTDWYEPLKQAGFDAVPRGLTLRRRIR